MPGLSFPDYTTRGHGWAAYRLSNYIIHLRMSENTHSFLIGYITCNIY